MGPCAPRRRREYCPRMRTLLPGSYLRGQSDLARCASYNARGINRFIVLAKAPAAQQRNTTREKENLQEPTAKLEVKGNGTKSAESSQDFEVDAVLAKELHDNGKVQACCPTTRVQERLTEPQTKSWTEFLSRSLRFLMCTSFSCFCPKNATLYRVQEHKAHQDHLHHWTQK